MKILMFVILVICLIFIGGTSSIDLKDIHVPSIVILNNEEVKQIVLDCQYEIDDGEKSLVVKWLKDNEVMYQWIRGNLPSVMPKFKDDINETFEISSNPNDQYRALALKKPSILSTGIYRCLVQTSDTTQSMDKQLQVIDISKYSLEIHHIRKSNETHLECTVENVYPEPRIHFETDDEDRISLVDSYLHENDDGYYNRTSVATVEDNDEESDVYRCILNFADYQTNITAIATSSESRSIKIDLITFVINLLVFLAYNIHM